MNNYAAMAVKHGKPLVPFHPIFEGHDLAKGWLIDSGASAFMTPYLEDLDKQTIVDSTAYVTTADGTITKSTKQGEMTVFMDPTNKPKRNEYGTNDTKKKRQKQIPIRLTRVLWVPNLDRRLFSVEAFTNLANGNAMTFIAGKIFVRLADGRRSEIMAKKITPSISAAVGQHNEQVRTAIDLDLLHDRLGHRNTSTILAASHHHLWLDVRAVATSETFCASCPIATIPHARKNRGPEQKPTRPLDRIGLDIIHNPVPDGVVPESSCQFLLAVIDYYSRYFYITPVLSKHTKNVIKGVEKFIARFGKPRIIRSDAGSEFVSQPFILWCQQLSIKLENSSPEHQHMNGLTERHYGIISSMARKMLLHACLSKSFTYFALRYATVIHNILPVKDVIDNEGNITTPFFLFQGKKPKIKHLKIFGCPAIRKRYSSINSKGKTVPLLKWDLQRGVRCIFIGLPENSAGWLFYNPSNPRYPTTISSDAAFDEQFQSPLLLENYPFDGGLQ